MGTLLDVTHLPCKLAIIQIKGHGKATDPIQRKGNRLAEIAAKEIARIALIKVIKNSLLHSPPNPPVNQ